MFVGCVLLRVVCPFGLSLVGRWSVFVYRPFLVIGLICCGCL